MITTVQPLKSGLEVGAEDGTKKTDRTDRNLTHKEKGNSKSASRKRLGYKILSKEQGKKSEQGGEN